ncbi:MAG: right-handed parallel beta-helix repeat-containing protein [Thermoplasmata archaeon]|nr:MAG: right-handed parallel beta-helix repeat-containing protein [Thermoplasmata archaeon]
MARKVIAVWLSLIMMVSVVVILDVSVDFTLNVGGTTHYVNTTGSGGAYTSIQDAINDSIDGDTVFVYNGTYYENVKVNKTLNLVGENKSSTVIDGQGFDVLIVYASQTNITGFTITNGSTAIEFHMCSYNDISDNIIQDNVGAILLNNSANNTIRDNTISDQIVGGLTLEVSNNNTVTGNIIKNNNQYGISLFIAKMNNITYNSFSSNTIGVDLVLSKQNNLNYNEMNNDNYGFNLLFSSNDNKIIGNNIIDTFYGVTMDGSSSNKIISNDITTWRNGIKTSMSSNNVITRNNITGGERGILLQSNSNNNMIDGNSATVIDYGIVISGSANNDVWDNICTGNNDYGIFLGSSTDNDIIGNNASNNKWGIYYDLSSNNDFVGNNVSGNSWHGIYSYRSSDNHLIGNNVSSNGRYGIDVVFSERENLSGNILTNDGVFIDGIDVINFNTHFITTDNLVNNKPLYYYKNQNLLNIDGDSVGQIIFANCTNSDIRNLKINKTDTGMEVAHCNYLDISYNNISFNNKYGIYMVSSSYTNVSHNDVSWNTEDGIFIFKSSYNNLSYNKGTENFWGIHFQQSLKNNLSYNNASSNNEGGIWIGSSQGGFNIKNNTMIGNDRYGLYLYSGVNNNLIEYNNISFTTWWGMYIGSFSDSNMIRYNELYSNGRGFTLFKSKNNDIIHNNVSNGFYGFEIQQSSGNRIYGNNIIGNTNQADDDTGGNHWNSSYPVGGNYWSDYGGVDNKKGPKQDISGSDGIGDTPYLGILGGSGDEDHYPLMEPYKPLENYTVLKPGWNLISIPLIQENQNMTKVLEMIGGYYDAVQLYDVSDPINPWKHFKVGKPFGNDLFQINETMGFWIHITQPGDTIFIYNGTEPSINQTILLNPGWNLVGYPSFSNKNRTLALNNITFGNEVDSIWTYDAGNQIWVEVNEGDFFEKGRGYWIHAKIKCDWEIPL